MEFFKDQKQYNTKKTFDQVTKVIMERSPEKWKTSYRDQFRKFSKTPNKQGNQ